jgi:acyl carrier protein
MKNITQKLKKTLVKVGVPKSQIQPNNNLKKDLGLDSLEIALLLNELEEQFEVQIEDLEWEKLVTVENLQQYLKLKIMYVGNGRRP